MSDVSAENTLYFGYDREDRPYNPNDQWTNNYLGDSYNIVIYDDYSSVHPIVNILFTEKTAPFEKTSHTTHELIKYQTFLFN